MSERLHIGYHASHEQFAPRELLDCAVQAEACGFQAIMCSDHVHPWSRQQGHSGHAWAWLGAAMQRCALPFGLVASPIGRQHPALVAQAVATLIQMHGARLWLAPGSGEALNERITGAPWPAKPERNRRLEAAVEILRALWRGERVDRGAPLPTRAAQVYEPPDSVPPLYAPVLSVDGARRAGAWADGLITISMPADKLRRIVAAFREHGGEGKPLLLQAKLSYADSEDAALREAHEQWKTNVFAPEVSQDVSTPEQFEHIARFVRPEDVAEAVHVSADLGRHTAWLQELHAMGFERIFLHNVNRRQRAFIDAFGASVLPRLR